MKTGFFARFKSVCFAMLAIVVFLVISLFCGGRYAFNDLLRAKQTELGMLNSEVEQAAKEKIVAIRKDGDTAGGIFEVRVRGLKSGFGSVMTYEEKLDAQLARGLMSIQAIKGVEIGEGFAVGSVSGREVHDEIFYNEERGFYRTTNRAGGLEGGMSNGEELVLRAAMKPIPTLMKGLQTVEFASKEKAVAASERSDVCAIFAAEVIAESVVAQVLADAVAKRLGGDTMAEVQERYARLPLGGRGYGNNYLKNTFVGREDIRGSGCDRGSFACAYHRTKEFRCDGF